MASRLLSSGRLYLGITFEGIPEETPLINVYLPATSTRFTGVHLDGSPAQSRGQQPDTSAGQLPAQEAESVEPAGKGVTVEPITGAPHQGTPAKPKSSEKQTPTPPAITATPKKEIPFTSPDLSFYDLVGKVKSCTIINEDNTCREVILFDRQGHVTNTDNKSFEEHYIVKRDGRGYITQLIDREPSYDDNHDVTTYSWTPGGKLLKMIWESSEGESTTIYTYDRFGALVKERTQGFQGDTVNETTTYEYLKIESHERPNWTERRVTWTSGTHRQQWTERRTITYYE